MDYKINIDKLRELTRLVRGKDWIHIDAPTLGEENEVWATRRIKTFLRYAPKETTATWNGNGCITFNYPQGYLKLFAIKTTPCLINYEHWGCKNEKDRKKIKQRFLRRYPDYEVVELSSIVPGRLAPKLPKYSSKRIESIINQIVS